MRNVEWKGRLLDPAGAERICGELGARHSATLEQRDTYFEVASGRLKRRECAGRRTEWIKYTRPDRVSARASDYLLWTPREAAEHFDLASLRKTVVVEKTRCLFLLGETRIHLDAVRGLGPCFELEALVNERQDEARARRVVDALLAAFKPVLGGPLAGSYSDLVKPL